MRIIRKVKDVFKSRRVKKLEAVIRQKDERIERLESENCRLYIALAESRSQEGKGALEKMLDCIGNAFNCLSSSIKDIDWNEFDVEQEEMKGGAE